MRVGPRGLCLQGPDFERRDFGRRTLSEFGGGKRDMGRWGALDAFGGTIEIATARLWKPHPGVSARLSSDYAPR
jgi:hypothetical protein